MRNPLGNGSCDEFNEEERSTQNGSTIAIDELELKAVGASLSQWTNSAAVE